MTDLEAQLWQKIQTFQFDPLDAVFPFSKRLAWDYRWSPAYTLRTISEYKRFLFLARFAEHTVSPSAPVDRVWHAHLLYTQSYWDDLCGQVLGQPLHHSPSLGGRAEGQKYLALYQQTLESYRYYFGEPPADIWHSPRLRSESVNFQWVDRQRYGLFPRWTTTYQGCERALLGTIKRLT